MMLPSRKRVLDGAPPGDFLEVGVNPNFWDRLFETMRGPYSGLILVTIIAIAVWAMQTSRRR